MTDQKGGKKARKAATAKTKQFCPVCQNPIGVGDKIQAHPASKEWVHPECAATEQNFEKEVSGMAQDNRQKDISEVFEGLQKQFEPKGRGLLAPEPTEEEKAREKSKSLRGALVEDLRVKLETMPYIHPDWLLDSIKELGDEDIATLARLYFLQMIFSNYRRINRLHQMLTSYLEKQIKDEGVELPEEDTQFTLDSVLSELANRIQGTRR